jgi:hypothetical protein
MSTKKHPNSLHRGRLSPQIACLLGVVAAFAITGLASAASIGLKMGINGNGGLQSAAAGALLPTDFAGAPDYVQANWNILGRWGDSSGNTPFTVVDSTGAATPVIINWDANNIWSSGGGGTPADQGLPDSNLMNAYLDSTGAANTDLANTVYGNPVANKPLVYISGLQDWLTAQGAAAYDVVIYSDGNNTAGQVGQFWLVEATGPTSELTYGDNLYSSVFICDRANFITTGVFTGVPASVQGGQLAQRGNFQGNYAVFESLTNNSFLLRTAEFNSRSPINAIQLIPRATAVPATIYPLADAPVYAGGTATFRATVSGAHPMTFQWRKGGVDLNDGGNISGATTATLTIVNASAADVGAYTLVVTNPNGVATSPAAQLSIVAPVAGSYTEKIATNTPYAYWRLNESSDTSTSYTPAYDYVGGFNGTYGNAALNGLSGVVGPRPAGFPGFEAGNNAMQSGRLVPRSWVVAPPLVLTTNSVTVCAWIHPTAAQTANTSVFASRDAGTNVFTFGYGNNANNMIGYAWGGDGASWNFASGLVPLTNAWSFIAITVTPSNAVLYLFNASGQLTATNTLTHPTVVFSGLTTIGVDPSNATNPSDRAFNGMIDEVAVFGRALSPLEVLDLYKKGLGLTAIAPVIATQPKSKAVFAGRSVTFNVVASGDQPLSYQWRRGGANLSNEGNVSGVNTPTLSITSATTDNEGNYDVVVQNVVGSATSTAATLSVIASNAAPVAYEAVLRAANPVAYWRLNETTGTVAYDYWSGNIAEHINTTVGVAGPRPPGFTGLEADNAAAAYDGVTSATDTGVSLMNNRAQFSIIGWFNSAGLQTARAGLFGQNDCAEFGFHGADIGIWTPGGGFASFAGQGQNMIIPGQWYFLAAVGNGTSLTLYLLSTDLTMQTSASVTTTNYGSSSFPFRIGGGGILDATGNYFIGQIDEVALFDRALSAGEVSDLFGAALTGGALPPAISVQPASATLYAGRNAQLNATAVGSSPLGYQWRKDGLNVSDGGNVSGATTPSLGITGVTAADMGDYTLVVTNSAGTATSVVATLTVITPAVGSHESSVIAANPIAYYRLNETGDPSAGNVPAFDFWGGRTGTYGGAAQNAFSSILGPTPADGFSVFESANAAVQTVTATANSFVTVPGLGVTTDTVTITAWLNPASYVDRAGIVFARAGQPATGINFIGTGNLNYHWLDTATTYNWNSGLNVPLNQWSFFALVVEPTQATMHLLNANGVQSAVNAVTHAARNFSDNIRIGGDPSGDARTFTGRIDEVAFFNYALTPAQILGLYLAVPTVTLSVEYADGNVTLTWPEGTLLEANTVTGPYTTNNAASPYVIPATGAQKYYRVIVK